MNIILSNIKFAEQGTLTKYILDIFRKIRMKTSTSVILNQIKNLLDTSFYFEQQKLLTLRHPQSQLFGNGGCGPLAVMTYE